MAPTAAARVAASAVPAKKRRFLPRSRRSLGERSESSEIAGIPTKLRFRLHRDGPGRRSARRSAGRPAERGRLILTSGPSPSNWRPAPAPAPPAGQLTIYEPENLCKCSARVLARGFGFKSRLTGSPPPRRRLARNG